MALTVIVWTEVSMVMEGILIVWINLTRRFHSRISLTFTLTGIIQWDAAAHICLG